LMVRYEVVGSSPLKHGYTSFLHTRRVSLRL